MIVMSRSGVALVGCGGITLQNHLPGLALCREAEVVALCDTDPAKLEEARQQTGVGVTATRYEEVVRRDDVQAVIIATPNCTHPPIDHADVGARKPVRCENPSALTLSAAWSCLPAANAAW